MDTIYLFATANGLFDYDLLATDLIDLRILRLWLQFFGHGFARALSPQVNCKGQVKHSILLLALKFFKIIFNIAEFCWNDLDFTVVEYFPLLSVILRPHIVDSKAVTSSRMAETSRGYVLYKYACDYYTSFPFASCKTTRKVMQYEL